LGEAVSIYVLCKKKIYLVLVAPP